MSCLECYKENLHFIQLRDLLLDTFLFQPLVECAITQRSLNAFGNKLSPKEVRIILLILCKKPANFWVILHEITKIME